MGIAYLEKSAIYGGVVDEKPNNYSKVDAAEQMMLLEKINLPLKRYRNFSGPALSKPL